MAEYGSVNLSFRVDKGLKEEADKLFKELGMNTSVALNMFLNQCVREQSFPFLPSKKKPSRRLRKALKEAEEIMKDPNRKTYRNIEELFEDLDA